MPSPSQLLSRIRDRRPIDRLLLPIQQFLHIEAAGGILLLGSTVLALVWANSPWRESYDHFWHAYVYVGFGDHALRLSLSHFVNDGLMAIFFFVVGLEIKREILVGELASLRKAAAPIAAAIGGMVVPALIYVAINRGQETMNGWAIPMATDIAFAVGVMAMLGKRVPLTLKIFVTALAIVDDIGAVIVIAVFYTSEISLPALGTAAAFIALTAVATCLGVRRPLFYAIIGAAMWVMLLKSGVHASIGGVLLALTIPARMRIRGAEFVTAAKTLVERYAAAGGNEDDIMTNPERQAALHSLETAVEHVQTPLNRLEHGLHGWVAFVIMPVFALANAGLPLGGDLGAVITSKVGLGIALGLIVGKSLGVLGATFLATKLGLCDLPAGTTWRQIAGAGILAGIGFTMSLFIANLAFGDGDALYLAKVGILCGSLVAGIAGFVLLRTSAPSDQFDS